MCDVSIISGDPLVTTILVVLSHDLLDGRLRLVDVPVWSQTVHTDRTDTTSYTTVHLWSMGNTMVSVIVG